jgi:hypothetical protein
VRLPHVCIYIGDLEISREDANNQAGKPIEHNGGTERIVRAPEARQPKAMTDQYPPLLLLGFFDRKAAPQERPNTEEGQQIGGDAGAHDLLHAVSTVETVSKVAISAKLRF